jgi:hypothetical protein
MATVLFYRHHSLLLVHVALPARSTDAWPLLLGRLQHSTRAVADITQQHALLLLPPSRPPSPLHLSVPTRATVGAMQVERHPEPEAAKQSSRSHDQQEPGCEPIWCAYPSQAAVGNQHTYCMQRVARARSLPLEAHATGAHVVVLSQTTSRSSAFMLAHLKPPLQSTWTVWPVATSMTVMAPE